MKWSKWINPFAETDLGEWYIRLCHCLIAAALPWFVWLIWLAVEAP